MLVIFADGGRKSGLGHLTRMRSLVRWSGMNAVLITRTLEAAKAVFSDSLADVVAIEGTREIASAVRASAPTARAVIIDPPYLLDRPETNSGSGWQALADSLRTDGRCVVRFTDEDRPTAQDCDLLVNDHPNAAAFVGAYRRMGQRGEILAGARYFLIDPTHAGARSQHGGLFVSFGGGDQLGLIARLWGALCEIRRHIPVHLVIGPACTHNIEDDSGLVVHRNLPSDQFAALLSGSRLAVTASGNTLFERVYHRVPGLSVAQSPHQDTIGRGFETRGLTQHLGPGQSLPPGWLVDSVLTLAEDEAALEAQRAAAKRFDIAGGCAEIVASVRAMN